MIKTAFIGFPFVQTCCVLNYLPKHIHIGNERYLVTLEAVLQLITKRLLLTHFCPHLIRI